MLIVTMYLIVGVLIVIVSVDIPCAECSIGIVEPTECTIYDAEFQVRLKQCHIVNEKPNDCTVCGVEFQTKLYYAMAYSVSMT